MKIMYDYQIFLLQVYGGVSRYHVELAKETNKINDSKVNIPVIYNRNEYLFNSFGIKKYDYNNRLKRYLIRKVNALYSVAESQKQNIVHLTWFNPYLYGKTKAKIIVTIPDMIQELFWRERKGYKKEIENKKRSIYESDGIIVVSNNTKEDLLKFYPDIPEEKIKVIYNGTNHLIKKEDISISLPEKYILYVGNRSDYKGFDFMIDALSEFLKERNDIKMLAVGGGPFSAEEKEHFEKLSISEAVIQTNIKDDELSSVYKRAICFIYPSFYEGFGMPILEAFDNDCPLICTNSSSLPEVGGDSVLYFEKGNAKQLEEAVISFVENNDKRTEYIEKGRDRKEFFTYEKCARETLDFYQKILEK